MKPLLIVQIIISLFLIAVISIQSKDNSLGSAFGGGSFHTKQSGEKFLFLLTIVLAVIFILVSLINIIY